MNTRDSLTRSLWQLDAPNTASNLKNSIKDELFDVIIIGAGITGLTTALLLQQKGKKCIVIENGTLGFGTTGGTSAHLNTFFDSTYPEIESNFGKDESELVAKAGRQAIQLIQNLTKQLAIECDLEEKNGFLFAQDEKQVKELEEILAASKRAGVAVEEVNEMDLPIPFKSVIVFKNQGQFHPLHYILGLAEAFIKAGGFIYENTFITKVEKQDELYLATSDNSQFKAINLVYATHAVPGINSFSFKCAPYRSYVIAVTLVDGNYPKNLAYDMLDPYHYFRSHTIDGQEYLLVGGEDHKTGQGDPEAAFKALEDYVRQYFNVDEIKYKWSSQYYIPSDGLPYIGMMPGEEKCYVATGYNGNGIIFGSLAGMMISDEIMGVKNEFRDLFSPSRIKPLAGLTEFVKENADVAWLFVADRFKIEKIDTLNEIENDSGKIVNFNGEKLAVAKDKHGKVTILDPVCTHAGCIVNYNAEEKSWDCPCHGGRFDLDGHVLCGPPQKNLMKHIESD